MGIYVKVVRRLFGADKLKAPRSRRSIVKVGFPAGLARSSAIMHAIWNEFGTRGGKSGGGWGGPVPERPFFRNTMRGNRAKYLDGMRKAGRDILTKSVPPVAILRRLGIMAQGDVQASITALMSPPNSPVTIKRKGSSKPLIDTGEMRQAVTYKVEE